MSARRTVKTRDEPRINARIYWLKGRRYAAAAAENAASGNWDPATANAVNAVINLTDALCIESAEVRCASEIHEDALILLSEMTRLPMATREGVHGHLKELLGMKKSAQYDGRLLSGAEADAALRHMERAFRAADPMARANGWTV